MHCALYKPSFTQKMLSCNNHRLKQIRKIYSRFRPDQKALEEGDIDTAETLKLQLENAQRERRKRREELGITHEPRWFSNPRNDLWEYNGKYWELRERPGFSNMQFESLW